MKKILLVSMMHRVLETLKREEPDLGGKTVSYIPTAIIGEADGDAAIVNGMIKEETEMLESLGLKVDVLDVSAASREKIFRSLTENDLIFVGGGNTFFLLQELKRSGADRLLVREVEQGKLYIGESAGAVVACPDIGYCDLMDAPEKAPELETYSALGLVDFYVVPHLDNEEMGEGARKIIETYGDKLDLKVITDEQAILVEGDKAEILDM